jgi:hypothetical protein
MVGEVRQGIAFGISATGRVGEAQGQNQERPRGSKLKKEQKRRRQQLLRREAEK